MGNLAQDVVVDILSRLPVESLLRFKCVCKSWCGLFESKEFIATHIVNQPLELITLSYVSGTNTMSLLLSDSYCHGNASSCLMDFNHLDFKTLDLDGRCWPLYFFGHCDGLVVVTDVISDIIICNFAIRESRYLPKSTAFHQYISENSLVADNVSIGLGYDYKSKDYKVVRIVAFWVDESCSHELPSRVEVFSLAGGDGSSWREVTNTSIQDSIDSNFYIDNYLNGVLYWLAYDKHIEKKLFLYCFNVTDEVFQKVSTPDGYKVMEEWSPTLGVLNKESSMALFYFPSLGFEWKGVHIWVMKESGVEESWTRQLITMGLDLLQVKPLALWKNDEQLVGQNQTCDLVSYDLSTLECKKLPVHHKTNPYYWQVSSYRKTLVSVYADNRRRNTIGATV